MSLELQIISLPQIIQNGDSRNCKESKLQKKIKCKNITITRGRNGSFSYLNSNFLNITINFRQVIDTIGAGDVFFGDYFFIIFNSNLSNIRKHY